MDYSLLRSKVVTLVRQGKLTPDVSGVVTLPANLKDASVDGVAYISNVDSGLLLAFNLTGDQGKTEYSVYAEKPISVGPTAQKVGPLELIFWKKAEDHWYNAVRKVR